MAAIKKASVGGMGHLVNDTFYYFGGAFTGTTAVKAGTSCIFSTPPAFKNCNSLSGSAALPAATMNGALALESAFFYISGGGGTDTAATTTVIKTVH